MMSELLEELKKRDFGCRDCGIDPVYIYMIKHETWYGLGLGSRDNLCIPCLSKRLGRPLKDSDFTDEQHCLWNRYIKVLSILAHGFYPGE